MNYHKHLVLYTLAEVYLAFHGAIHGRARHAVVLATAITRFNQGPLTADLVWDRDARDRKPAP